MLVSVWLTTPYFFLVSMGALQSIPSELTEAARVDGGGAWQIFRRVTLPLLLVAVAPLMIASFAFNFNNFNNVYLLTGGGPYNGASSIAGNTDILISYTYKLAIATGKGSDYGLASAVAIIIFFIVAGISAISFWRTEVTGERAMSIERSMSASELARSCRRGRRDGAPSRPAHGRSSRTRGGGTPSASSRICMALFPVVYIVSSAFNRNNSLQSAQVIPTHVTLHNFGSLLHNNVKANTGAKQDAPYLHWFLNSMLIVAVTAIATTVLGALAAYAFSRFRFRGRRRGMLALLLIQMFPQFVAVAAIYLIVLNVGERLPTARAQQAGRGGDRLPRRRDGRAGVADEGLLRHDPDGARRVGERRRRNRRADLLGRRPAARRAGARRRRADLVRLHAERVRDRLDDSPDDEPLHAAGRHAALHQRLLRQGLGPVHGRRAAGGDPGRGRSSCSCSGRSSAA